MRLLASSGIQFLELYVGCSRRGGEWVAGVWLFSEHTLRRLHPEDERLVRSPARDEALNLGEGWAREWLEREQPGFHVTAVVSDAYRGAATGTADRKGRSASI